MFREILINSFGESSYLNEYIDLVTKPDAEGELHHILPKSIFPEYKTSKWNLVTLSIDRHFKAHSLLPSIVVDSKHRHKMLCAMHMMLKHKPKGYDYEKHKLLMSEANMGENNPMFGIRGEKNPNYGKPLTEERKENISKSLIGEKNPMYGKPKSEEFKRNLSVKHKGKRFSDNHKQNISISKTGEKHPMWGKHKSDETKQKIAHKVSGCKNGGFGKTFDKNPNARAILFDGVVYTTSMLAAIELDVNKSTIVRRMKSGKAIKLPKNWRELEEYSQYKVISELTKKD